MAAKVRTIGDPRYAILHMAIKRSGGLDRVPDEIRRLFDIEYYEKPHGSEKGQKGDKDYVKSVKPRTGVEELTVAFRSLYPSDNINMENMLRNARSSSYLELEKDSLIEKVDRISKILEVSDIVKLTASQYINKLASRPRALKVKTDEDLSEWIGACVYVSSMINREVISQYYVCKRLDLDTDNFSKRCASVINLLRLGSEFDEAKKDATSEKSVFLLDQERANTELDRIAGALEISPQIKNKSLVILDSLLKRDLSVFKLTNNDRGVRAFVAASVSVASVLCDEALNFKNVSSKLELERMNLPHVRSNIVKQLGVKNEYYKKLRRSEKKQKYGTLPPGSVHEYLGAVAQKLEVVRYEQLSDLGNDLAARFGQLRTLLEPLNITKGVISTTMLILKYISSDMVLQEAPDLRNVIMREESREKLVVGALYVASQLQRHGISPERLGRLFSPQAVAMILKTLEIGKLERSKHYQQD